MTNYENLFYNLRNEVDKTVLFKYVNIFGNDIFYSPKNKYMCVGTTTPVAFRDSLIVTQIGDDNLHYEFRIANNKLYTMVHFENKYDVNSCLQQKIENYCTKIQNLKRYDKKENAFFYYIDGDEIDLSLLKKAQDSQIITEINKIVPDAIDALKKLDQQFRG